jgi:surface carbohydrate biosynthesis protein
VKKISIIIDNPQRDLAGYTYLAEELVKKNYLVFLTPMYNFHEIFLINPDLVILNHARKEKIHSSGIDLVIKYCRLSNIKTVVIDSEGGIFRKNFIKKYKKFVNESANLIDKYFLWGSNKINLIYKKNINKFIVTGNPRFDLFFLKNYKNKFLKKFKKKNFILVNTSFVKLNPIEGDIIGSKELKNYKTKKLFNDQKFYFNELICFLKSFSKINKNINFIVRPHPFESKKIYENEFANCKNIKVMNKGDIFFYLKKCIFVINHNCQTSLDAVLAGKNSINFSNFKLTRHLSILDQISTRVRNKDELEKKINIFLSKKKVINLTSKRKIVSEYYENIKNISSNKIVNNILLLLNKSLNQVVKPSILRIIKIYIEKRSFLEIMKFILKIFLGTRIIFTLRSFFGNQLYKRKYFKLSDVLDLIRLSQKDKLIVKQSSILDLHFKSLLFSESIIIKKNL